MSPCPPFLTLAAILGTFGSKPSRARVRYQAFVADGLGAQPLAAVRGQLFLGSEQFITRLLERADPTREVPRFQREPLRPTLGELFARSDDDALLTAYREHGYRLHEIAAYLGVHYSTVSRRLAKLEAQRGSVWQRKT